MMNQATDEQIIKWIKSHRFSDLAFLNDCWKESNNEKYIGFYYFICDIKNENVDNIWAEIVKRKKSESEAYLYLGGVVHEIYNSFEKNHIFEFFYRKSIALDDSNSKALWRLYKVTKNNDKLALKSIFYDFENARYNEIEFKLRHIYPCFNECSGFSKFDWEKLKEILIDVNVKSSQKNSFLISTYFNLNEFDKGLDLINSEASLSFDVIKPFYEKGLVDITEVADKIYDWQYDELFLNDNESIYKENLLQFKKDINPTVMKMIQLAFKAEKYADVIRFFQEEASEDPFFLHDKSSRLYYLLSQLFLNEKLDDIAFNYIKDSSNHLRDEEKILYQFFNVKLQIRKIISIINTGKIDYHIDIDARYQLAIKLLDERDLRQHYLFQCINNELISLKCKWNEIYKKANLDELSGSLNNGDIDYDSFLNLINLSIDAEDYQFAIEKIIEYHDKFQPTMSTYNGVGVCYERSGEIDKAYQYYKCALNLMLESKDHNHVIISNYIRAFELSKGDKLKEDEYNKLRDLCNKSLANDFEWNIFTSKNHSTLFKYQPFNINTIDSIINKYFYLASKKQLNDPIEMPNLEGVGKEHLICSDFNICSLTQNDNSMLMWSHYAQQHEGIMVEYWFGGDIPDGVGIAKIKYDDDNKRENEKNTYVFNQYLLTKNKEWLYENEVRLFSYKESKIYYDLYNYPYHDRNKINAVITSITLGYKFPQDKVSMIKNIITQLNESRGKEDRPIILRETILSKGSQFAIEYQELSLN